MKPTRYPLAIFLHGHPSGGDVIDHRLWTSPPEPMPPPMRTAEEQVADLEYLRKLIDDATDMAARLETKP